MTTKKQPVRRSRRTRITPRRAGASIRTSSFRRFINALTVSAIVSFTAASCVLHPQFQDSAAVEALLERVNLEQFVLVQPSSAPPAAAVNGERQTVFAPCLQFFPDQSPPVVPDAVMLQELCFTPFAILHDGDVKTPVFVAQRLNRQMLVKGRSVQRKDRFYEEARLPAAHRARLDDYRGSGYSRGHMAPAGDMHSIEAMEQSFSLANMVPQNQIQNAGAWSKIEQDTRKYVMRAKGDVYVFTGPVYEGRSEAIGEGRVGVPSHLYKAVCDATTGRSWVHWQENSPRAKAGSRISYGDFERRTGLRLFATSSCR